MANLTSQGYGDFILLGGVKSPGLCDVSGASSPRKWDQAVGYGMGGAVSRFLGNALSEFSIKFRLYGDPKVPDPDWQQWNVFESVLMKPPVPGDDKSRMFDIWHPVLQRLKIKAVGVVDVGQPYQSDDGEWTIEVKFIEWRQPKPQLAKPEGAKATPIDPYERIIDQLDKQIQEAAK
jgi:hypothetical protein